MRHNRCSLGNCGDCEIAIKGRNTMAVQEDKKPGGLANSLWMQMVKLVIAAVVVLALAEKYLW
jgi:hypothetical protein